VNLIRNKALTVAVIGSTTLAVSVLGLPSQAATSGHRSSHTSVQERGAGTSSATGDFLIETSPDGTTSTPAAHPIFGAGDGGHLNPVPARAGQSNVQFVRATIEGNQVPAPFGDNCPRASSAAASSRH
jgi:hypothetical protein